MGSQRPTTPFLNILHTHWNSWTTIWDQNKSKLCLLWPQINQKLKRHWTDWDQIWTSTFFNFIFKFWRWNWRKLFLIKIKSDCGGVFISFILSLNWGVLYMNFEVGDLIVDEAWIPWGFWREINSEDSQSRQWRKQWRKYYNSSQRVHLLDALPFLLLNSNVSHFIVTL